MSVFEWVSIVLTLASMAGAAVSWWRSTLSTKAKDRAEDAAELAARHLVALESIAKAARGPRITASRLPDGQLSLTNTGDDALTITGITNRDEWVVCSLSGALPLTLERGQSTYAMTIGMWGAPGPAYLSLTLGDGTTETVPLPGPDRQ